MSATLLSIATTVPAHSAPQASTGVFMKRVASAVTGLDAGHELLGKLERFYARSGIERRYSVIPDYMHEDPAEFTFFPKNWELEPFPTTADRMKVYRAESVAIAQRAGREALERAGVAPSEVTDVIFTSCTGFFAPGPDVLVAQALELPSSVRRMVIGFMGCYAGFNGMRQAQSIVEARPGAVVLQICLELCSLHYQRDADMNSIVANCLFADGCAAVVWGGAGRSGRARLVHTACDVSNETLDQMYWQIGDHGFRMGLSPDVPASISEALPAFVDRLIREAEFERDSITRWAPHPGGRAIIDASRDALGIEEGQVEASRSVLRDYGNMSSATILFVLDRLLEQSEPGERLAAFGFGPGLTLEGALYEVGP